MFARDKGCRVGNPAAGYRKKPASMEIPKLVLEEMEAIAKSKAKFASELRRWAERAHKNYTDTARAYEEKRMEVDEIAVWLENVQDKTPGHYQTPLAAIIDEEAEEEAAREGADA